MSSYGKLRERLREEECYGQDCACWTWRGEPPDRPEPCGQVDDCDGCRRDAVRMASEKVERLLPDGLGGCSRRSLAERIARRIVEESIDVAHGDGMSSRDEERQALRVIETLMGL